MEMSREQKIGAAIALLAVIGLGVWYWHHHKKAADDAADKKA